MDKWGKWREKHQKTTWVLRRDQIPWALTNRECTVGCSDRVYALVPAAGYGVVVPHGHVADSLVLGATSAASSPSD